METITVTCVGMGYDDKREAVNRFWNDYLGELDVERGLFVAFEPDNRHDSDAVAIIYYPGWMDDNAPSVQEIWSSEVSACSLHDYVIGYVTKDDIPTFVDFFASLIDNDWETAAVTFEIEEIRLKNNIPTWMVLTLNIHD
jgi:hypothetical protein